VTSEQYAETRLRLAVGQRLRQISSAMRDVGSGTSTEGEDDLLVEASPTESVGAGDLCEPMAMLRRMSAADRLSKAAMQSAQ
jgi:hypothetical protein